MSQETGTGAGVIPRLSAAEWAVFTVLAAGLAVTNIYTTLLTGWGDGGSIIAVLASVLFLGVLTRRRPSVESLNLGQTMASAGGSVGFSVCAYAAIKMVDPEFVVSTPLMIIMFVGMAMVGTVVGASVRNVMVRYYFPSGTACAVIQRTVTSEDREAAKRPIFLLKVWGGLAGLITIPTKIATEKGGHAILGSLKFSESLGLGLSMEPLLYGIGIVVGPRIGLGMMLGALSSPFLIIPLLKDAAVDPGTFGDWVKWMAIAVLTLPTFATILFAYYFRVAAPTVSGFSPGATEYPRPRALSIGMIVLTLVGTLITAVTCQIAFQLSWPLTILTVAVSWPLCIMNGRVTGDTDINPVRLVAIVLLTAFAWLATGNAIALLGMAIIGGTLAGMGVDMMQDYRTGYLIDKNPHHQTVVQVVGSLVGAIAAVPFILYLDSAFGFGEGHAFLAPGGQIWSAMAKAFAGGAALSSGLITAIVVVSVVFCGVAFLQVWPKTGAYVPSLFGIGIGLLLPFEMCFAIFLGGIIKWGVTLFYVKKKTDLGDEATRRTIAGDDTMLAGASVFAASAIVAVLVVIANGLGLVHLSGH